jgi:hypothetical protein
MNIQLSGAEEYIDQKMTGALGQVLIRYVNCASSASAITKRRVANVVTGATTSSTSAPRARAPTATSRWTVEAGEQLPIERCIDNLELLRPLSRCETYDCPLRNGSTPYHE